MSNGLEKPKLAAVEQENESLREAVRDLGGMLGEMQSEDPYALNGFLHAVTF